MRELIAKFVMLLTLALAAPAALAQGATPDALLRKAVTSGKLSAAEVAQKVYEAVRDERFYILTHPKIKPSIQWRMEDILQERNPTNPMG